MSEITAPAESRLMMGAVYEYELLRDGVVYDRWVEKNLMPLEGVNHVLNVVLKGATPVTSWYVLLYEGNYTPVTGDTAATFPASCTETTAYSGSTRVAFTPGAVSGGTVNNSASRAEFTFTADKTIYGGAIASASAKGAVSGVLLSAVKFGSPKSPTAGDVLRVTAGFTLVSA